MAGVHWPGSGVRATRRCLIDDLDESIPTLDVRLENITHAIVEKAQQTPQFDEAGQCERIVSVTDRIWVKVKTQNWRGASINLSSLHADTGIEGADWWLGAAGQRREDSPKDDFYASFEQSCITYKKRHPDACQSDDTCSNGFTPIDWDYRRLEAERAFRANDLVKSQVRFLARESMRNGRVIGKNFEGWQLEVCIRADGPADAEAYIVITGAGLTDPVLFALILSAIPGLNHEDWMPEPSPILGMNPQSGEIVWSAILTPEVQATLLVEDE